MKSPIGMEKIDLGMEEIDPGSSPEDCYQLKKGIYGLCQAARQFWKKFVDTIKKETFGFQVRPADHCMLFKEIELGICIIIMYVDDMLIIGKEGASSRLCLQNTKGIFSENTAQPCRNGL